MYIVLVCVGNCSKCDTYIYIYLYMYISVCICVCVWVLTQLCLTLCNPMYSSLPGSTVHGIFQARMLEWVAVSSSKGFF